MPFGPAGRVTLILALGNHIKKSFDLEDESEHRKFFDSVEAPSSDAQLFDVVTRLIVSFILDFIFINYRTDAEIILSQLL